MLTADDCKLSFALHQHLSASGYCPESVDLSHPPQTIPKDIEGVIIVSSLREVDLLSIFVFTQRVSALLSKNSGFYLTIARMDGRFGTGSSGFSNPVAGGLAGFSKSVAREYPDIFCRVIDVSQHVDDNERIVSTLAPLLFARGEIEMGFDGDVCGQLQEKAVTPVSPAALKSRPDDTLLFTGGGRGITFALLEKFLRQHAGKAIAVGTSDFPPPEPEWLQALTTEKEIKKEIIARFAPATPRAVDAIYSKYLKNRQLVQNLSGLHTRYPERFSYHKLDITDKEAVAAFPLAQITGIVHGAGVLNDRLLVDLTRDEFLAVYAPKVTGLENLLAVIDPLKLRHLILFSSSTARYGRKGQLAYCVANEVMNKYACQFAHLYPETKTIAFNFGPWQGGMVTAQLEKIFQAEGIDLIPIALGTELCLAKIFSLDDAYGKAVELLVAQKKINSPSRKINFNLSTFSFLRSHIIQSSSRHLLGNVGYASRCNYPAVDKGVTRGRPPPSKESLCKNTDTFSAAEQRSELKLDGDIVLPVALILDVMLAAQPTMNMIENFHVLQGVIFPVHSERELLLQTKADLLTLQTGDDGKVCYRAQVSVANTHVPAPVLHLDPDTGILPQDIYRAVLFHGPDLQVIRKIFACNPAGIAAQITSKQIAGVAIVDSVLQLTIVHTYQQYRCLSLPTAIKRYRLYRRYTENMDYTVTVVRGERKEQSLFFSAEIVAGGKLYATLTGIEMIMSPDLVFQRGKASV